MHLGDGFIQCKFGDPQIGALTSVELCIHPGKSHSGQGLPLCHRLTPRREIPAGITDLCTLQRDGRPERVSG